MNRIARLLLLVCIVLVGGLAGGSANGAAVYVSPNGDGSAGTNWTTAFTNLQAAVNVSGGAGDIIYLRYGTYSNGAEVVISGKPGLTLQGGYAGTSPEPGDLTNLPTVITRLTSVTNRIFNVNASTVTWDRVTISNGYISAANGLGAGICITNGSRGLITNCIVTTNGFAASGKGAGIYATGSVLVVADTVLSFNYINAPGEGNNWWGGGMASLNSTVQLVRVSFLANRVDAKYYTGYGGGLYLFGGQATLADCNWTSNRITCNSITVNDHPYGGGLYAESVTALSLTNCGFRLNYAYGGGDQRANAIYLKGAALTAEVNSCTIEQQASGAQQDMYLDAAGSVAIRHSILKSAPAGGLLKTGAGTLTITNCLVVLNSGPAVDVRAGTVNLASCTLAGNLGVGLTNSSATVVARDCIVWGNTIGGITGTVTVTTSCLQETRAGTGNFVSDPLFIAGYYLSSNGLPAQTVSSPCFDVGSGTASALGLNGRTTLTDGTGDAGQLDLGYHYATGSASSLSNLTVYVNSGVSGSDANNGWTADAPLKTLTNALAKVLPGGTIFVAAGIYSNGVNRELFPLTINAANVTLKGAGPATTIIDAQQSGRILYAASQGNLRLEGLTFRNGLVYNDNGAGLYLYGGNTLLTNCIVVSNRLNRINGDTTIRSGAGIYNSGGLLTVAGCQFLTNIVYWNGGDYIEKGQGGGICAENAFVNIRDSLFRGNSVNVKHYACYGGAVCLVGGSASIFGSTFVSNTLYTAGNTGSAYPYGGALYASGVNPLAIDSSTFQSNYSEVGSMGGAVYLDEAGKNVRIVSTVFSQNGRGTSYQGDVHLVAGYLALTNCLMVRSTTSGLRIAGGTATVVNCTLAGNAVYGLVNVSGTVSARHCIAWGNVSAGLYNCTLVNYSDSQETLAGTGNRVTNPLFADTNYYHLVARAGFFSNGWFSGGTWAVTTNDSPLIDAGDIAESWRDEPQPNGRRINIGAYGGSPVASKTFLEEPGVFTTLTVHSYPATNIDLTQAWLNGEVLHTGGAENPEAYFCWGDDDAGTTATSFWDHVVPLGAKAAWDRFTTNIVGFSGTTYFRCYVTNSTGADWSANPAESFTTVSLPTVTNTGATAIRRTSVRLNGQILATGGQDPSVWFAYWPDAGAPTSRVALMSPQTGVFAGDATNLTVGTLYHYSILASNAAGSVWSGIRDFTTLTADPIGRYVAPGGAGAMNGLDWANAYSLVQDALLDCTYAGDTIYLRYGVYSNATQIALTNVPGLIVRGEYAGAGAPGDRTNLPSALKVDLLVGNYARALYAEASTATFDRVTFRDGYLNNSDGAGLYLTNSRVTLTNCTLANNRILDTASATIEKGGGIFASGGRLDLFGCQFQTNTVYWSGYSHDAKGGAVYGTGVVFTAVDCVFNKNTIGSKHFLNYGGALALEGGSAQIRTCTFTTNSADASNNSSVTHLGGAIYAYNVAPFSLADSLFAGNYSVTDNSGGRGGALYLGGSGLTASVVRCVFNRNGGAGQGGDVCAAGGSVGFTNNLMVRSSTYGVWASGAALNLVNCTLAGNSNWGVYASSGIVTVRNCIVWGNTSGGISNASAVSYTCSQETQAGTGNFVADPLFVDTVYYHEVSASGHYIGGFFSGGSWVVVGAEFSPCIDRGDPSSSKEFEPIPSGRLVNLGAYGNTSVASLSRNPGTLFILK